MIADIIYGLAAFVALLLLIAAIDIAGTAWHERRIRREREQAIARYMAKHAQSDIDYSMEQRRIRGEMK